MKYIPLITLTLASQFAAGFTPSGLPIRATTLQSTIESDDSSIADAKVTPSNESDNINPGTFENALEKAAKALEEWKEGFEKFQDTGTLSSSESSLEETVVDYNAVAKDIVEMINNSKESPQDWGPESKSVGPTLIRLAWHSSGTYAKVPPNKPPVGGSEKGTIRFEKELEDPHNGGLADSAIRWMNTIYDKYPGLSHGDLYTLAGVVAVKTLGGPTIPWGYGRVDGNEEDIPPPKRLPDAATPAGSPVSPEDAEHLRQVFGRMGFDDQEIVILSGAHAVGRCRPENSGYDGPWTFTEDVFSNAYYRMLNVPLIFWRERRWDGPTQYRLAFSRSTSVMMLPTDIALKKDRSFRKYVRKYARDEDAFFEDFAKTFSKLLALGTKDLTYIDLEYDIE